MKKEKNKLMTIAIMNIIVIVAIFLRADGRIKLGNMGSYFLIELALFVWIVFILMGYSPQKSGKNFYKEGLPYRFDYMSELDEYSHVGKEQSKYKKYSEWKKHVLLVIEDENLTDDDKENFYRYLKRKYRSYCDSYRLIEILLIPIMLSVFSSMIAVFVYETYSLVEILIILVLTVIFYTLMLTNKILQARTKIYFIEDVIDVLFPQKERG